jgi:hypothetical protein
MKLDLLTNATVVDDAIRFLSNKTKEKLKSVDDSNEDDKESDERDYDEEKQEKETSQIPTSINQVFSKKDDR